MQPSKGLHNQVVKIVVPYCPSILHERKAPNFKKPNAKNPPKTCEW